jgi:hypothetical protein
MRRPLGWYSSLANSGHGVLFLSREYMWRSGVRAPSFLTKALDECEWPASRPWETALGTHWIGSWVGPRAGLDAEERRKSLVPSGNRTLAVWPAASHYTDWAIPVPYSRCDVLQYSSSYEWTQFVLLSSGREYTAMEAEGVQGYSVWGKTSRNEIPVHVLLMRHCCATSTSREDGSFTLRWIRNPMFRKDSTKRREVHGVSKRALHLWKLVCIYSEEMYSVFNYYNVAKQD